MRISFRTVKFLASLGDISAKLALKMYVRQQCDLARNGDVFMKLKLGTILVVHDFTKPVGA